MSDPRSRQQPNQPDVEDEGRMGYRDTPGNEGPAADLPSEVKKIPPQDRPDHPGLDLDPAGPGSHQGNANDLGGSSAPVGGEVNSATIGSREGQRSSFGSSSGTMPDTEARDAAAQTSAPTEDFGGAGQGKDET